MATVVRGVKTKDLCTECQALHYLVQLLVQPWSLDRLGSG